MLINAREIGTLNSLKFQFFVFCFCYVSILGTENVNAMTYGDKTILIAMESGITILIVIGSDKTMLIVTDSDKTLVLVTKHQC